MELEAGDALAQIHEARARIAAHNLVRLVQSRKMNRLGRFGFGHVTAFRDIEECAVGGAFFIERTFASREKIASQGGHFAAFFLEPVRGFAHAERVPGFKRAQLPVVAPLHCVIHRDRVIGNFREPVGGVANHRAEMFPRENAGLISGGAKCANAFSPIRDFAHRFQRSELRLLLRPILHGLVIQSENLAILVGLDALVKALSFLLTPPAALDHVLDEINRAKHSDLRIVLQ